MREGFDILGAKNIDQSDISIVVWYDNIFNIFLFSVYFYVDSLKITKPGWQKSCLIQHSKTDSALET